MIRTAETRSGQACEGLERQCRLAVSNRAQRFGETNSCTRLEPERVA